MRKEGVLLVNFRELLGQDEIIYPINPIEIFNKLDRRSGKEFLRDPQKIVLKEWFEEHRSKKEIIVKLHTGQGKTLIGLLMLQSFLNEGKGPVVYICPDNYLVDQTVEQAIEFGIKTTQFLRRGPPPLAFLNSEAILVTNCQKVFNGKSVFGVRGKGDDIIQIGAFVMDDAHKCLDIIKEQFSISIDKENSIYQKLWGIFRPSLERQAEATVKDIEKGMKTILTVPFWTWFEKITDVLTILAENNESEGLLFTWDLIKNHMHESICIFSGEKLEISPRIIPISNIPSFSEAEKRIFLSATLFDDTFLVKGIGLDPETVINPLASGDVKYCGERLIIIPSLVDIELDREKIISWVHTIADKYGTFGVFGLTPSFGHSEKWEDKGAVITDASNLAKTLKVVKTDIENENAKKPIVLVNKYDGVDLPDNTCRILVLDSLPSYKTLMDRYLQETRPFSGIIRNQLAQRVEQGMGRGIRGFTDYCIVIVTGRDLTNFISNKTKRKYLSKEAQLQIEIGEKLAGLMRKDDKDKISVIEDLVRQCLMRDQYWKNYYEKNMAVLEPDEPIAENLGIALTEREAELLFSRRQYQKSSEKIQQMLDKIKPSDKGWYLQLMATYLYPLDPSESMNKQLAANMENSSLFRPEKGVTYSKLTSSGNRISRIKNWLDERETYNAAIMEINGFMDDLLFGDYPSETFESSLDDLGKCLGFVTDRPEKKLDKGPDNLWNIQGKSYWVIECKNQVKPSRKEISKNEAGQMSNSIGWFNTEYEGDTATCVMIHPATKLAADAFPSKTTSVLTKDGLYKLKENTRKFYISLQSIPFDSLTHDKISEKLNENKLNTNDLVREYLVRSEH